MPRDADHPRRAVVLVSGGLDSATVLAMAQQQGFSAHALSLNYGQRHISELDAARRVCAAAGVTSHKVIHVDLRSIGGSALTDDMEVPQGNTETGIPVTYVPARNTILLSLALGWAEVLQASELFIGITAVDYSGYPDCRPVFIEAFQRLAAVATKYGIEGHPLQVRAPLIHLSKAEIIRKGVELGVDYAKTVSCYQADESGRACGACDSCRIRREGFAQAGVPDPTRYGNAP